MNRRIERDALGEVRVPGDALYGAQTQRAVENFPISGLRMPRRFLWALGLIKAACAAENAALAGLDPEVSVAIATAATEVAAGTHDAHFPIDPYQTGSGTSTNMNANEVIAHRASALLGGRAVHPNDDVNRSQSSNDVIPTALHLAAACALAEDLIPALRELAEALGERSRAFADIVKSGRTHLMDATPVTLGQEFSGYAAQAANGVRRAERARDALLELALGGTAVGTGLNRPVGFPERVIAALAEQTGIPFVPAENPFEAQAARDGVVEAHGQLAAIAASLTKIANDLRWLGSGPRAGLYEIALPAVQPGSSIMPGKVNPVMPEMLVMVAARVAGNQTTVVHCGMAGAFELNATLPLLAIALLESIALLANGTAAFTDRCVRGIVANREIAESTLRRNLALCTALAPVIGYERAAALSKEAFATGRGVRDVALAQGVLPEAELDRLLDPMGMTRPG